MTERPPSKNAWLRMSPLPRAVGIVCLMVGAVWLLQGIGVAQGSVMTGSTLWAILGALVLVVGALVLQRSLRTARQAIADDAPATETQAGVLPPGDGQSTPPE